MSRRGALHRIDCAREFSQDAVAGRVGNASIVFFDKGVENSPSITESEERSALVPSHEPRIASHVSREDGCEASRYSNLAVAVRNQLLRTLLFFSMVRLDSLLIKGQKAIPVTVVRSISRHDGPLLLDAKCRLRRSTPKFGGRAEVIFSQ